MWKRSASSQVLQNEEFRSIITALGAGFDKSFDKSSLKYHKIIILADADQDGAHIRAILLTFFFRYYRSLIADGHIFIAQPPLYSIKKGKQLIWAHTDKQLEGGKEKSLGAAPKSSAIKGLGEMSKINFGKRRWIRKTAYWCRWAWKMQPLAIGLSQRLWGIMWSQGSSISANTPTSISRIASRQTRKRSN